MIIALGMLAAIGPMSIDMYLPSFTAIAHDFGAEVSRVGYSLSSYFIGISLGQLAYGPLMDRFGRRLPLLAGLVIYCLAALGCGLSPNLGTLVFMRFMLALGGCAGMVGSRAVVRDLFPVNEAARVYSLIMLVMGVAPMVAPSIGGMIVSAFGWRFIFAILALFSMVLAFITWVFIPDNRPARAKGSQGVSADPSAPAASDSLHSPATGQWAGTAARDLARVARNPAFMRLALAGGFSGAGMFAYIACAASVFMQHFGYSKTQFGLAFGLNAVCLVVGSQLNRRLLRSRPIADLTLAASAVQALTATAMAVCAVAGILGPLTTSAFLMTYLFCHGFLNPNTTAMSLGPFGTKAGSAAAVLGSLQMVMATVASIAVSAIGGSNPSAMAGSIFLCALSGFALIARGRKGHAVVK